MPASPQRSTAQWSYTAVGTSCPFAALLLSSHEWLRWPLRSSLRSSLRCSDPMAPSRDPAKSVWGCPASNRQQIVPYIKPIRQWKSISHWICEPCKKDQGNRGVVTLRLEPRLELLYFSCAHLARILQVSVKLQQRCIRDLQVCDLSPCPCCIF